MILFITGGSGSGKSEYAEMRALERKEYEQSKRLVYVATMEPLDDESRNRVKRHRQMRKEKSFETRECYTHLENLEIKPDEIILLECLSNLTANEMFAKEGRKEKTVSVIKEGILRMSEKCQDVIVVGNNVFEDGIKYEKMTQTYVRQMAELHCFLAEFSDEVVEVLYGLPVYWKGAKHEVY